MDVFLMIRRKKTTIFTDAKDNTSVGELKKMIEGILKVHPSDQRLFKNNDMMNDEKQLQEYGITISTARAQSPAQLGLALRLENGEFEELEIAPYSSPPDLPDVMKNQDSANGQETTHITS
ncbi:elongin-B isoform X2 [Contarinia nasturtii]|uniref:elongin-B isoform X2 n=1 Tax=Contarinia nasturtii TaxID=265458 RepID=UPI0012D45E15|nr:elongin-B isoform X2 [Contarinia nasturtii]